MASKGFSRYTSRLNIRFIPPFTKPYPTFPRPMMASPIHTSHEERTSHEPRDKGLHEVIVNRIDQVNDNIRLFRLNVKDQNNGINFLPGQWLDVHVPGLDKAGGFTITSTPADAQPGLVKTRDQDAPYVELAIQRSPRNPPAAWMWKDPTQVMGQTLKVRVGGSFVWPPPVAETTPENVLLVAGGVGINPLISILTHLHKTKTMPPRLTFFYGSKGNSDDDDAGVLFLPRLKEIARGYPADQVSLQLYLTGSKESTKTPQALNSSSQVSLFRRRMELDDLERAVGNGDVQQRTWTYICGPQRMTDTFVEHLSSLKHMNSSQVLCEKWW